MSDVVVRNTTQVIDTVVQEIKVKSLNQHLIVNPADKTVAVVLGGPVGPPGIQGPPGSNGAAVAYLHTQVEESTSWVINHDLGFFPNVTVAEAGTNIVIEPGEIHHSVNQLELQFNTPRAGTARLS